MQFIFVPWVYYTLFFATPLIVSIQSSEMFEWAKILFIYGIAGMLLGWGFFLSITRQMAYKVPAIVWVYLLFLCSQIIATFVSPDKALSWYGAYGRWNGGLLSTIAYGILLYSGAQFLTQKHMRYIAYISITSACIVVLWGIPGVWFHWDTGCLLFTGTLTNSCWAEGFDPAARMFSTIGQPNWLATYLVPHIFIAYWVLHTRRVMRILVITLFLYGVYATGSRSGMVALCGGVLLYLYISHKRHRMLFIAATCILCVIGGIFFFRAIKRDQTVTHSGTIRLVVWQGALKMAQKYPLFGAGVETFGPRYQQFRPLAQNKTTEWNFIHDKAHNEFLHILATSGGVGIGTYLIFLGYAGMLLWKTKPLLCAGWCALHIAHFFGFSTTTSQLLLYVMPLYAIASKDSFTELHMQKKTSKIAVIVGCACACVCVVYTYLTLARWFQADSLYAQDAHPFTEPTTPYTLWHQDTYLSKDMRTLVTYFTILKKEKNAKTKETQYIHDTTMHIVDYLAQSKSYDPLTLEHVAYAYAAMGDTKKALHTIRQVVRLAPTSPLVRQTAFQVCSLLQNRVCARAYCIQTNQLRPHTIPETQCLQSSADTVQ